MADCEYCRAHARAKTLSPSHHGNAPPRDPSPHHISTLNASGIGGYNNALQHYFQTFQLTQHQIQQMAISHAQMAHHQTIGPHGGSAYHPQMPPFLHPSYGDHTQPLTVMCEKHTSNKKRSHNLPARRRYHYMNSVQNPKTTTTTRAILNSTNAPAHNTLNPTSNSLLTTAVYQPSNAEPTNAYDTPGTIPNGYLPHRPVAPGDDIHLRSNGILIPGNSTLALASNNLEDNFVMSNYNNTDHYLDDLNLLSLDDTFCDRVPPPFGDRCFDDFAIPYFSSTHGRMPNHEEHLVNPKPVYGNLLEVIEDRLKMYKAALEKAKQTSDQSKVKRYTRQIKTLEDQKRSVHAGKVVKDEEIPGPITMTLPSSSSSNAVPTGGATASVTTSSSAADRGGGGGVGQQQMDVVATVPSSSSGSEHSPTTDLLQLTASNASSSAATTNQHQPTTITSSHPHHNNPHASAANAHFDGAASEDQTLLLLKKRAHEYKVAAQLANKQGDKPAALKYVKIIKGFEEVISAVESGKGTSVVDIATLPGPPPLISSSDNKAPSTDNSSLASAASSDQHHQSPVRQPPRPPQTMQQQQGVSVAQSGGDDNLDALLVRMNVFKEASEKAKQEGDQGKARRQGRMEKQYMDAIKAYKTGRPVAWDDLTNPPGFPPLPNSAAAAQMANSAGASNGPDYDPIVSLLNAAAQQVQQIHSDSPASDAANKQATPSENQHALNSKSSSSSDQQPPVPPIRAPPPVPPNHPSRQTQQGSSASSSAPAVPNKVQMTLDFLEKRQQQYRSAAIAAKKRNELDEAKRYLKLCKGFDPMIAAAKLGKPVDLAQVPPALTGVMKAGPTGGSSGAGGGTPLVIPVETPVVPKHSADPKEVACLFQSIEQQLQLQINKCKYDSEYYASIGEISNVNKAEKMLQCSAVDLNVVQACRLRGELPPKMHYEQRAFTKIRVNNDLNEGECEVGISRAINLPCADGVKPSEMSTYAKWAFPWPSESSTSGQTNLVKNTDNPVYNFKQRLPISDRKERMSRHVKRKTFDITVFSKGGIFKSDRAIGVAQVKLDALDKKCTLHEVVQLMDPVHTRSKSTCGKIEVSIRVREPFVAKDTEDVVEKWLVVDAEPTAPIQPRPVAKPQQIDPSQNPPTSKGVDSNSNNAVEKKHSASSKDELNPNSAGSKARKKSPRPPPRGGNPSG